MTSTRVLLLHGLGATGGVWDGVAAALGGDVVAPDLPGHGSAATLPAAYTFAALAEAVADHVDDAGTVVLGHSFGGVVALHLAARPGVRAVVALGVKVAWSDDDLARAAALAARPSSTFATRADAVQRHLRVSGLAGLVDPASDLAAAGVVAEGEGNWRLAQDTRAFAVGDPEVAALLLATPVRPLRGRQPQVGAAPLPAARGRGRARRRPGPAVGGGRRLAGLLRPVALHPRLRHGHRDDARRLRPRVPPEARAGQRVSARVAGVNTGTAPRRHPRIGDPVDR